MKKLSIIAIALFTIGCQQYSTLDTPMTTAWTKYEPEITGEPNYHVMLKSKTDDFCLISMTKASIDAGKEMQATFPGHTEADMDCHYNGKSYTLDQSDDTYLRVVPGKSPTAHLAVTANLSDTEDGNILTINIETQAQ